MSRKRYISTDISTDTKLAELSDQGLLPLLLFTWSIPHMDDWGRITGDPRQFKLLVCPALDVSSKEVDQALDSIAAAGLWTRYEVEGKKCIFVPDEKWFKHQSYINKSKRTDDSGSNFPRPPENTEEHRITPQITEEEQTSPQNSASFSLSFSPSPLYISTTTGENEKMALGDIYTKVFGTFSMTGQMSEFFMKMRDQGLTEEFCIEMLLEASESCTSPKPSLRYLESIRDRWINENINSREEAKQKKEGDKRGKYSTGHEGNRSGGNQKESEYAFLDYQNRTGA